MNNKNFNQYGIKYLDLKGEYQDINIETGLPPGWIIVDPTKSNLKLKKGSKYKDKFKKFSNKRLPSGLKSKIRIKDSIKSKRKKEEKNSNSNLKKDISIFFKSKRLADTFYFENREGGDYKYGDGFKEFSDKIKYPFKKDNNSIKRNKERKLNLRAYFFLGLSTIILLTPGIKNTQKDISSNLEKSLNSNQSNSQIEEIKTISSNHIIYPDNLKTKKAKENLEVNSEKSEEVLLKADYKINNGKLILKSNSRDFLKTTFNLIVDGKIIDYKSGETGEEIIFNLPKFYSSLSLTEHTRNIYEKITHSYRMNLEENSLEKKLNSFKPKSEEKRTLAISFNQKESFSYEENSLFLKGSLRKKSFETGEENLTINSKDLFRSADKITSKYNSFENNSQRAGYMRNQIGINEEEAYSALNLAREEGILINYSSKFLNQNNSLRDKIMKEYSISKSTKELLCSIEEKHNIKMTSSNFYKEAKKWKEENNFKGRLNKKRVNDI
jgi:hypothetical protein